MITDGRQHRVRLFGSGPAVGVAALMALVLSLGLTFPRVAGADESVEACGFYANNVFTPSSAFGISASATCPGGSLALQGSGTSYQQGQGAIWQVTAPANMVIVGATIPAGGLSSDYVNAGSSGDWGGDFYWTGGNSNITPAENDGPAISLGPFSTDYFGWLLVCGKARCRNVDGPGDIYVNQIALAVRETSGPWLNSPSGLWQANGWVRGTWNLEFWGDSPSGLCGLVASLGGSGLPGSSSSRDPSTWHQCAAGPVSDSILTQAYPQGANTLDLDAWDAAGETVDYTKTVDVDNSTPSVALSGPSDAPTSAGTQDVTATATAGPSGVAGIACSTDGAPAQWYSASSAQVPVSGIGQHVVQCFSENNAVDANGVHGQSALESFAMNIREPTVSSIGFSRIVDKLRCHRVLALVTIPAGWVLVHRDHKLVRVHRRARTGLERVTRCHARTKRERVTVLVKVRRHGRKVLVKRTRMVRVVEPPHVVTGTSVRVPYGHAVTVNGWLGTDGLTALAGEPVQVLTAPDNGLGQFVPAASVVTSVDGSWSAQLPAGSSRLVMATYQGDPLTEPTSSAQVKVVVPAKVRLISVTRRVAWGATVRIVGQLDGGYLPPGGALVRMRIGQGSGDTTYGVKEHVSGHGRFSTTYTFGAGDPGVHRWFWFQVASLPMGDYPFAPASSRRRYVLVGGHP